jgi:PTS system nitrogen regulatory IIA component
MRISDFLSRNLVFIVPSAKGKRDLLEQVARRVCERLNSSGAEGLCERLKALDDHAVLARLMEREEQVTTGIGHGVAIPHATIEGLERTHCIVVQIPGGVDFQALDVSLVHVVFLLLSPPKSTGIHIRLLARIARLVDDPRFVASLARANDEQEIHDLIVAEDGRHV